MEIKNYNKFIKESDDNSDDIETLLYLIRTFLKNQNSNAVVSNRGLDITIEFTLNSSEKLKTILNVFDIAKRIKNDLLAQYDSEFEMYTDISGLSKLVFDFYFDELF
jgi:hypothetical protein